MRCRGVALITVLLILALITPIITHTALKQRLSINRTSALDQINQSISDSLAVETWARSLLLEDLISNQHDSLDEIWAKKNPVIFGDDLIISVQMYDLQGRININGLASSEDEQYKNMWLTLLTSLGISRSKGEVVTQAIEDWIDEDNEVSYPGGAEDIDYMNLSQPYRAANQIMTSTSELIFLRGMDRDIINVLTPFVTTFPEITPWKSKINLNTAPIEILRAIFPDKTWPLLEEYVEKRLNFPFKTMNEFKEFYEIYTGEELDSEIEGLLGVRTNYFRLDAVITFKSNQVILRSYLKRSLDKVEVLGRSFN